MPARIALDIETTGLDSARDAIIEIAAVKFEDGRIQDEWHSLIRPDRKVPAFVTQLTGITDAMLQEAPHLESVLPDLLAFVGEAPIVGHNVDFDLGFLRSHHLFHHNEAFDTYELATVLIPSAGRYNLGALGATLGLALPASHRALDDARLTHALFVRLVELACALPVDTLAEFVELGRPLRWRALGVFQDALRQAIGAGGAAARQVAPFSASLRGQAGPLGPLFATPRHDGAAAMQPRDPPIPIDIEALEACLQANGPLAAQFGNFEVRPQQVQMMRAVCEALSSGNHMLVEAGTGTGKSIAYLLPAARWAIQNSERVVVSTHTIHLQEQLLHKDIPDLERALGWPVRAAVLKGRRQYLCPRRLDQLRRRKPQTADQLRLLAKVMVWLSTSQSGDRSEITLSGPGERQAWSSLCAEDEDCTTDGCWTATGGNCPLYRARRAAEQAHIVIVNHALLLADIASNNRVLPEYRHLIVDEAHHLEAATTDGLSFRLSQSDLEGRLKEVGGGRGGHLGRLTSLARSGLVPENAAAFQADIHLAVQAAAQASELAKSFFSHVASFAHAEGQGYGEYTRHVRLRPFLRTRPGWEEVEANWDTLREALISLADSLERLARGASELQAETADEWAKAAAGVGSFFRSIVQSLDGLIHRPDGNMIYWVETHSNGERASLHAAPLHVGPLIEKHLWNAKRSVILTSATLTAGGEFDYLKARLNGDGVRELAVGSPFDYQASTLLYLVNDMPEPRERSAFQHKVEDGLTRLFLASRGRGLALFTSYAQLKQTAQAMAGPLSKAGISLYVQDEGASRHNLLTQFRTAEQAVLLGTRSFWEGVDIPGPALSVLAIVKLPFDVPSDPIIEARAETFENPFYEYHVPEAILRVRQGFGRLIRSTTDRGVVAIFDQRLITKPYGRAFVESLPACTRRQGPVSELPAAVVEWLHVPSLP